MGCRMLATRVRAGVRAHLIDVCNICRDSDPLRISPGLSGTSPRGMWSSSFSNSEPARSQRHGKGPEPAGTSSSPTSEGSPGELAGEREARRDLNDRTELFRRLFVERIVRPNQKSGFSLPIRLAPSVSSINALIVPGNNECQEFCKILWNKSNRSIRLYPIRSPTVPKGSERVRIIIHSHNTEDQVIYLISLIQSTLCDMGIIPGSNRNDYQPNILSRL